ncbi:MAG: AMP-binding protein [Prevotella sp.]|nr:AMP-binding protein [Prevotella sp.]
MGLEEFIAEWRSDSPTVLVHTSGSTGQPKPMLVEKRRMEASARITCGFLGLKEGDSALLCMPLDYIAGKMMVVRALTCGLRLVSVKPCGLPAWEGDVDFAAMVPLQVWNLLHDAAGRERLMHIRHLIIGGGAIDDRLARTLKTFPHAVWSTYGMTETLSHIALRRLSGPEATDWYTPFEGVALSQNADGCLVIDAPAVHDGLLVTNDMVEMQGQRFRIIGRKDNVICSGGLKIQIEEVERLLKPHIDVPFCITKRKDERFGEAVILLTVGDPAVAQEVCRQVLPKHWVPRQSLAVEQIPLTETGKVARKQAERLAALAVEI